MIGSFFLRVTGLEILPAKQICQSGKCYLTLEQPDYVPYGLQRTGFMRLVPGRQIFTVTFCSFL